MNLKRMIVSAALFFAGLLGCFAQTAKWIGVPESEADGVGTWSCFRADVNLNVSWIPNYLKV